MSIKTYFKETKREIDKALDKNLPKHNDILNKAMRYSVFSGGKRLRPILVIATAEMLGAKKQKAIMPACAIELIHNFTLIHDDLPCIDNDDFRRGKLSLHKAYNEAVALLAGDALFNSAFNILTKDNGLCGNLAPSTKLKLIREVSGAIGTDGMVSGEAKEVCLKGKRFSISAIEDIYMKKTATLISVAVRVGAIIGKANKKEFSMLTNYGKNIGIAFQITDDILEFVGGESKRKKDEPNYVLSSSLENAKKVAEEKIASARENLQHFGKKAERLLKIADYIINRTN